MRNGRAILCRSASYGVETIEWQRFRNRYMPTAIRRKWCEWVYLPSTSTADSESDRKRGSVAPSAARSIRPSDSCSDFGSWTYRVSRVNIMDDCSSR